LGPRSGKILTQEMLIKLHKPGGNEPTMSGFLGIKGCLGNYHCLEAASNGVRLSPPLRQYGVGNRHGSIAGTPSSHMVIGSGFCAFMPSRVPLLCTRNLMRLKGHTRIHAIQPLLSPFLPSVSHMPGIVHDDSPHVFNMPF
jgi:hypothetical protein